MSKIKITFTRSRETELMDESTIVAGPLSGGGLVAAQEIAVTDVTRRAMKRLKLISPTCVVLKYSPSRHDDPMEMAVPLVTLADARERWGKCTLRMPDDTWLRVEIESWKDEALRLRKEFGQ